MPSRALPLALLLMALAAPGAVQAQESLFGHQPDPKSKTRIECVALFSRPAPGGYLPVRVTVNNANEQDGSIELKCTSGDGGYNDQGSQVTSTFKLSAPAGKVTRHEVLVPCTTMLNYFGGGGGGGAVNVGVVMTGSFGGNSGNLSTHYDDNQPAVLMSEALYTPNGSTLDAAMRGRGSMSYGGIGFAGKFNPTEMPDDWRAYSGYDGLVMTDADWTATSPGARTAILRWNRLGGRLVILAQSTNSDLATLGISSTASGVRNAGRSLAF
jgi:hypothetical protein